MNEVFVGYLRESDFFHRGADPYEQMETARKRGDHHSYEMWRGIADQQAKRKKKLPGDAFDVASGPNYPHGKTARERKP